MKCNLYEDIYYFYIIIIKQLEPSFDIYINENKSKEIEDNKELKFLYEEDYHNHEGNSLNRNYQKAKRNKLQKLSLNFNIHVEFISNKYIEIPESDNYIFVYQKSNTEIISPYYAYTLYFNVDNFQIYLDENLNIISKEISDKYNMIFPIYEEVIYIYLNQIKKTNLYFKDEDYITI